MTDKELQRLRRHDLLELLLSVSRENEELKAKLAEAEEKLAERNIHIQEAGNIAEAAMRLNGLFQAAQNACDQYLDSVHAMNADTETNCANMMAESTARAQSIIEEAETRARVMEFEAKAKAESITSKAKAEAEEFWDNVSLRLENFYEEHAGLRQLLAMDQGKKPEIAESADGQT